jgi:hypothetical protein
MYTIVHKFDVIHYNQYLLFCKVNYRNELLSSTTLRVLALTMGFNLSKLETKAKATEAKGKEITVSKIIKH